MGSADIIDRLELLGELAGTWRGSGFNLIARPDFRDQADLYLQLNQTNETLRFDPINASVPNRGFGQGDIELFGLTYHQQISDAFTGGLLHVEPGLWITQPATVYPPESPPPAGRLVSRLGTIPHGNSLLAQGAAQPFTGPPTLEVPLAKYAFSQFPSFNSTPFRTNPTLRPIIHAAGTSEKLSSPAPAPFTEYDLAIAADITNPRTPFATFPPEPPLPAEINGVPMQDVVNDPIKLLQAVINQQVAHGKTFEGVALNISTQSEIEFFVNANSKFENGDPTVTVRPVGGAGGIENILFLQGGDPVGSEGANANASLAYATFWIEKVSGGFFPPFMQLQYAQMVILDFEVFKAPPNVHTNIGWPHISVATLTKSFI
ncbi:MAG TPA: heme-binding protein [Pseudonocardiaceae bacterium]|nr:heme-binding protein [Pseudonocardiaceae bacterium]